jgi:hypothetical protein
LFRENLDLFVGNQGSFGDEFLTQARLHEAVIVLAAGIVDLPVEYTVAPEEEPTGIPEGTGKNS